MSFINNDSIKESTTDSADSLGVDNNITMKFHLLMNSIR